MIKPRGIICGILTKPRVKWFKAGCKACINKPHEKSLLRHHDAAGWMPIGLCVTNNFTALLKSSNQHFTTSFSGFC